MPIPLADALRDYLRDRDVNCPGCNYNVRDLPGDRCPECGQQLGLALSLTQPRQGALITGLVALAAGAGLGGLLLIYALLIIIMTKGSMGRRGFLEPFIIVNFLGLVGHGACLFTWIRNWNRIRLVSTGARNLLVLGCIFMPIVFIVIFTVLIR